MNCSRCGRPLPPGSAFCPACGFPVQPSAAVYPAPAGAGVAPPCPPTAAVPGAQPPSNAGPAVYQLTLTRQNQWFAVDPPMQIQLNSGPACSLNSGQSLLLTLPEGLYCADIHASFRSRSLHFYLNHNGYLVLGWDRMWGTITASFV